MQRISQKIVVMGLTTKGHHVFDVDMNEYAVVTINSVRINVKPSVNCGNY